MGIRVNPDFYSGVLSSLGQLHQQESQDLLQLATGKKLNTITDDPAATAELISNATQTSQNTQFVSNVSNLRGALQTADSSLSSVVAALTRAVSLGTEGANGTLNDSDRQAVAVEVRGIQQQLLGLANTSYNGNYVFAGTASKTQPYVLDPATSTVSYQGNTGVNSVQIGEGQYTPTNLPGSQIFGQAAGDVFASINDLAVALETNGNVAAAGTEVQDALTQVTTQRAFYGNTLNRLDTASQFLTSEATTLSTRLNDIDGADPATVATNLSQVEVAKNATLEAAAKVSQLSLLDYLK